MSHIKPTRDNNPKWLSGLKQHVEKPVAAYDDTKATLRNHGGDEVVTAQATYDKVKTS